MTGEILRHIFLVVVRHTRTPVRLFQGLFLDIQRRTGKAKAPTEAVQCLLTPKKLMTQKTAEEIPPLLFLADQLNLTGNFPNGSVAFESTCILRDGYLRLARTDLTYGNGKGAGSHIVDFVILPNLNTD